MEVVSIIFTRGSIPSLYKIISRYWVQSLAIFPNAQIAYSAISECGDLSNWQNNGIAPLSIIVYVWWVVPEAIFVKAQAASSYKCYYWSCLINSSKRGIRFASITFYIGVLSSIDNNFLNPITP